MKKTIKRVLALMMAVMVLVPAIALPVFAVSTPIDKIVLNLKECYAGAAAENVEVIADGNLKTDGGYGERYSIITLDDKLVEGKLASDGVYLFFYRIEAREGYTITDLTPDMVTLNGYPAEYIIFDNGVAVAYFYLENFGVTVLRSIEFSADTKPIGGNAVHFLDVCSINRMPYLADEGAVIIDDVGWYEGDEFSTNYRDYDNKVTVFTAGKAYDCYQSISADDGYVFSRSLEVTLDVDGQSYRGYVDMLNSMQIDVDFFFDYYETPTDIALELDGYEFGASVTDIDVNADELGVRVGNAYLTDFEIIQNGQTLNAGIFAADTSYQLGVKLNAQESFSFEDIAAADITLFDKPAVELSILNAEEVHAFFDLPQLKSVPTAITEIVLEMEQGLIINDPLHYAEVYSVNGNTSLTGAVYGVNFQWYYADELEDDADDYWAYNGDRFAEGLSFDLYCAATALPGYELSSDCQVKLITPSGMKVGKIYTIDEDYIGFDFFWNELIRLSSITVKTNAVCPVVGKSLYYPEVVDVNGWNKWEGYLSINDDTSWYYSDSPTEIADDYEEFNGDFFLSGYAYDLWVSMNVADFVTIDGGCSFTLRTPHGTKTGTLYAKDNSEKYLSFDFFWDEARTKDPLVNPFTDVKKKDYFYNAVLWAAGNDITGGTTPTTFAPNDPCTRAQAVAFLWRAAGSPEPTSKNNPFTDVKKKDYFYNAVLWAVEEGITAGATKTTFAPNDPCTRGQIVSFMHRASGSPNPTGNNNPFTDVKKKDYYYKAVLWAVEEGITAGATKTTFEPGATCTRGQIVSFLYRYNGCGLSKQ